MCEVFNKKAMEWAKNRLKELAISFVEHSGSEIKSDIIITFYLGVDGRPVKYKTLGNRTGLGRMKVQKAIRAFREFVEKRGLPSLRVLKLFEDYRIYYWNVYSAIKKSVLYNLSG